MRKRTLDNFGRESFGLKSASLDFLILLALPIRSYQFLRVRQRSATGGRSLGRGRGRTRLIYRGHGRRSDWSARGRQHSGLGSRSRSGGRNRSRGLFGGNALRVDDGLLGSRALGFSEGFRGATLGSLSFDCATDFRACMTNLS